MKLKIKKKIYRWPVIISIGLVLAYGVGVLLSMYMEREIKNKIFSLHGKVSSIKIDLITRSVKVKNLEWSSVENSQNHSPHLLCLKAVTAEGIDLYELIMHKKLLINVLVVDSGTIQYNKNNKQPGRRTTNSKYKHFSSKHVYFTKINMQVQSDTVTSFSAFVNCHVGDASIKIDSLNELNYSVATIDGIVEKLSISRGDGMYGGTIARVHINTLDKKIIIDSAELIPNFGKYEFAHHRGKQTDRIGLSIPKLIIKDLQFDKIMDSSFVVSKIEIKSFDLFVFRDKRVPFQRKENVPLPMASFLKLPFRVKIDSVVISDSRITIEEFPEHGINSGIITFIAVNATMVKLNNRQAKNDHAYSSLSASGLLMGSGKVNVLFQFPQDGSLIYTAKGSISNMPFKELNPVLTSMADIRVKSGHLKNLAFDFKYDEFISKGNVNIDYEDLRLTSLNTNKSTTHEVKTFLIHAFVRNHRKRSLSITKKNGVINVERDRKRFIFNVWSRSILDGLKSGVLR